MDDAKLAEKLGHWVREYGPGGLPHASAQNIIQTIMEHRGFIPSRRGYVGRKLDSAADEVEFAVKLMECTQGKNGKTSRCYRAAKALRIEYLIGGRWPVDERLSLMEQMRIPCSEHEYKRLIQAARCYLHGFFAAIEARIAKIA